MRTIYLNGQYMPEVQAKVSVFDRGFLFADAVYEVVSVMDGKLVDFGGHITRLGHSMAQMSIAGAPGHEEWLSICRELVLQNELSEGMIYWQVTRGNPGDRSFFWPAEGTAPTVLAFTQALALAGNPAAETGITVATLPDLRWGRADIKTTQLLYASMMKMEAKALGADDAWLTRDGFVTEGTSQNAHIITKEGVLVTHQLDRRILHGNDADDRRTSRKCRRTPFHSDRGAKRGRGICNGSHCIGIAGDANRRHNYRQWKCWPGD
jgi:D-alanine transaminase